MDIRDRIRAAAAAKHRAVVLPEGEDPRVVEAAALLTRFGIARVVLVGDPRVIQTVAGESRVQLRGIEIVQPEQSPWLDAFAQEFCERRKHKGITIEQAREAVLDPIFFGAMMLRTGRVDGLVAGCVNVTAKVVRACIQVIGAAPGIRTVSSCCVMVLPDTRFGYEGVLLFADTGVVPDPTAR